mmetsp:Transcript_7481/g.15342  ORF Transcript_7481/g.15342 Transcript_7481/m.15342 type:complete len:269 (+) Transcript_7481:759-1565(+)
MLNRHQCLSNSLLHEIEGDYALLRVVFTTPLPLVPPFLTLPFINIHIIFPTAGQEGTINGLFVAIIALGPCHFIIILNRYSLYLLLSDDNHLLKDIVWRHAKLLLLFIRLLFGNFLFAFVLVLSNTTTTTTVIIISFRNCQFVNDITRPSSHGICCSFNTSSHLLYLPEKDTNIIIISCYLLFHHLFFLFASFITNNSSCPTRSRPFFYFFFSNATSTTSTTAAVITPFLQFGNIMGCFLDSTSESSDLLHIVVGVPQAPDQSSRTDR